MWRHDGQQHASRLQVQHLLKGDACINPSTGRWEWV